jgi:hypothetical protein
LAHPSNGDESNFVFAGGTSDFVGLYDLRMDGSRLECLQSTNPLCFDLSLALLLVVWNVSKDGKELLVVSYEGDSIYTFPYILQVSSAAGPTLDEGDKFRAHGFFQESYDEETHLPWRLMVR